MFLIHLVSADLGGAGFRILKPDSIRLFSEFNFNEFVRVRFDGILIKGNTVQGSRCSDPKKHFAREDVSKAAGVNDPVINVAKTGSGLGHLTFSTLPTQ